MAKFDFSDIQKASDEKFGDFIVTVPAKGGKKGATEDLTFRHLLRVSKEERRKYAEAIKPSTYEDDEEIKNLDAIEGLIFLYKKSFGIVAKEPRDLERLEETIRDAHDGQDDLGDWEQLFALYQSETHLGEA